LATLAQRGWLSTDVKSYRLSPVVQKLVLEKNKDTLKTDSETLVNRLNHLLETDGFFTKNLTLTQARPFADVGLGEVNTLPMNTWARGFLYDNLTDYFKAVGLLTSALHSARQYQQLSVNRNDQESLAISYGKLGGLYQALGDLKQARTFFEKYLQLNEQLAEANPESVGLLNGLAISYYKLGMIQVEMEQLEEARKLLKQAEQIWITLAEAIPDVPEYSRNLGIVRQELTQLSGDES